MPEIFVLLYVSTAAPDAAASMGAITRAARMRNAERDITGVLAYDGDCFVQWLEGGQSELSTLLQSLRHDGRHHDLEVLAFEAAAGPRRHEGWDLGYHFVENEADALVRYRGLRGAAAVQDFLRLAQDLDIGRHNPAAA